MTPSHDLAHPLPTSPTDRNNWLSWICAASPQTYRQYHGHLLTGSAQLRALCLAHPAASPDDLRQGLLAISQLVNPWVNQLPWSTHITRTLLPTITGRPAVQLFLHLYRAVQLNHVSPACLPTAQMVRLALLPLELQGDPKLPEWKRALRQAARAARRQRVPLTTSATQAAITIAQTEGYGRNGVFSVAELLLSDRRRAVTRPYAFPHFRLTAVSHAPVFSAPLSLDLSEADARTLYDALGALLARPSRRPRSSRS